MFTRLLIRELLTKHALQIRVIHLPLTLLCLLSLSCTNGRSETGQNKDSILPQDVLSKIESEYADKDHQEYITHALVQYADKWQLEGARVPRCILFLAEGDFASFKEYLNSAEVDWRDVIYWAENDGDFKNHKVKQVYDFNRTFEENGH